MKKFFLCAVLCAGMAFSAFAGCGASADVEPDSEREPGSEISSEKIGEGLAGTEENTEENVEVIANGTYAVITKGATDSSDSAQAAVGFREVVEAQGGTCITKEPATGAAEDQVAIVNQCVSQGVDAIAIAANDAGELQTALQAALELGIHVVGFDSPVSADSREVLVSRVEGEDSADVGRLAAYASIALVNGTITGAEGEGLDAGDLGKYVITAAEDGGTELLLGSPGE